MNLSVFAQGTLFNAIKHLFGELAIPVDYVTEQAVRVEDILGDHHNPDNASQDLIDEIYPVGIIDDAIFEGQKTFATIDEVREGIAADYEGLVVLGVTLHSRANDLLPTRTQLADITRAINRAFLTAPVVVIFRYGDHLTLANTKRTAYQQTWREGEKVGKVSILRNINIHHPHTAHQRVLQRLAISRSGSKAINNFKALYQYWQEKLDVSVLNKAFYQELANWYFWAIRHVQFPGEPERAKGEKEAEFNERLKSHRAQNVIRLVTRLMFSWFLKEKGLIPASLFDQQHLRSLLNLEDEQASTFYKAILQNLFFATLNQEMDKREFRKSGQHYNTTNLYRYEALFSNASLAIDLFKDIPFLNGGLFECLDKKNDQNVVERVDGFSDRNDVPLSVPNYLFFSDKREEDLSEEFGQKSKKYSQAKVKGLINLLDSYVFTVTENTPIEEDVALDPELLGKVFENLLASYNPETKTTARKQTGSFYTPREIVNYMVDESLIAYLKTELLRAEPGYVAFSQSQADFFGNKTRRGQLQLENKLDASIWSEKEAQLDEALHQLFSYDPAQPFAEQAIKERIISALDRCTILDPACGSGAFPMGVLQKMVHVLQKLDPRNVVWKEVQTKKAKTETKAVFDIEDRKAREERLIEINNAFDYSVNDPDYARKLFLIEDCLFGVDIQPIAVQIAKLRFFISLIVDQKPNSSRENLGIRPLPNLETKFVAANTLIGLDRPQQLLIRNSKIEELEKSLTEVRHRHFSAKTPKTKRKWREQDQELREQIATLLINDGWNNQAARQVAEWDPYDQNSSAPFFDLEWMFGIADGLDIVIGNPPYFQIQKMDEGSKKLLETQHYHTYSKSNDLYTLFYESGHRLLKDRSGLLTFITSNKWMRTDYGKTLRKFLVKQTQPRLLIDFGMAQNFESATTYTNILVFQKSKGHTTTQMTRIQNDYSLDIPLPAYVQQYGTQVNNLSESPWIAYTPAEIRIKPAVEKQGVPIEDWDVEIYRGVLTGFNKAFYLTAEQRQALIAEDPRSEEIIVPLLRGENIKAYQVDFEELWMINTHNGVKGTGIDRIDAKKNYPAVYGWLKQYEEELKRRQDQGDHWSNLRNCAYIDSFTKPKIIYPNMTKYLPFVYDEEGYFCNQKCYIMTGKHLKYLTAFFNSSLFKFCFRNNFPELLGDTYELSKVFFEKIPVKQPNEEYENAIDTLVDLVRNEISQQGLNLRGTTFLQAIDGLLFNLYFDSHTKEQEIAIFDLVKYELSKVVVGGQPLDHLSREEKETVATQLYQQWSHPDNEVHRRMNIFAERSPDILKPILESR